MFNNSACPPYRRGLPLHSVNELPKPNFTLISLFAFVAGCINVPEKEICNSCPFIIRIIWLIIQHYRQPSFSLPNWVFCSNKQGPSTFHIHPPVKTGITASVTLLKTAMFCNKLTLWSTFWQTPPQQGHWANRCYTGTWNLSDSSPMNFIKKALNQNYLKGILEGV